MSRPELPPIIPGSVSARMARRKPAPARVGMISLGCPKNLVDTEVLLGKVSERYVVCADPRDADVVIVNTCAFIDQARDESLAAIRQVAGWKSEGKVRGLVVAGCMAQRYGGQIREKVPEVDSILAMAEYDRIGNVLEKILDERAAAEEAAAPWRTLVAPDGRVPVVRKETARLRVTPRHYAYLRISEGCSNACTFCAIPNFRGLFRSKPMATIVAEAKELVASGAVELNLISQDTTDWGRDLEGKAKEHGLALLLEKLSAIEGVRWIRMLYAYPGHVSDELIRAMRELQPRVLPYLDMPVQHLNSRMLKRMGRRHTREETFDLVRKLRTEVPNLALRTSVICGFPGETEAEHDELVRGIEEMRFERLGAFPYSHEPGTPAGEKFPDDIPHDVKLARVDAVMTAQRKIAFEHARALVGRDVEVLVEGEGDDGLVGRTVWDAPEIDPIARLSADAEQGEIVTCKVVEADGYDVVAETPGAPKKRAKKKKAPSRPRRLPLSGGG